MEGDLKTLLKMEFDIDVDNEVLKNIPREKQDAALLILQRLQLGRNLFASQTCTERVASSLVKWVEAELEISKLESTLGYVLSVFDKVTETSVAKVVTIVKYSRISINSMLAGAYLLGDSITKERIVYEYIGFRKETDDEEAWGKVVNRYKGYKELADIPGFVQKALKILEDETENRDLHAYAQFIYDSYQIVQEVDSNLTAKEQLKKEVKKIISGTGIVVQPINQSFFSRIATAFTTTVVKAADAIQTFIINGVQAVNSSLKTTYTSVKEFFTGVILQKDEAVIQSTDLSGQISNALPGVANKENATPAQPSSQSKPTPPASSFGGSGSIPQIQQELGLIKSEFFRNDKTAEQIIASESPSVDIRTFTDDINLIQKGISNSPELFEYKVISALRMLGMSRPGLTSSGYFIGEMLLNKFQKLHGLEISPFVTANVLGKIDTELAFREQKDKELAQRFPLYSKFTESLPNQPTKEHVVALYTLAFESLPPHLVRWDAQYFESFLRAQARDLIVNPSSNKWGICTTEWFMYGVVSRPCPTKISIQEGQVVGFWDEMNLIDTLLHEYAHFLDKSVGYSHVLTIDTAGFNSISFFKHNPEGYTTKNPEEYYKRKQPRVYATEFVTQYAINSPYEDFAESFVMYVSQGKVFRELANRNQYLREKYDWLKKNVFNGIEYNTGDIRGISIWQRSIEVNKNYFESQPLGPIISMPSHPATYSLVIPEYIFEYAFLGL
jgi:hypothetical protein